MYDYITLLIIGCSNPVAHFNGRIEVSVNAPISDIKKPLVCMWRNIYSVYTVYMYMNVYSKVGFTEFMTVFPKYLCTGLQP